MQLPRRETPTPPRGFASLDLDHEVDRLRAADLEDTVELLGRMSVSFAGLATNGARRAICRHALAHDLPAVVVARRDGMVVGCAMAIRDSGAFWRSFFLRHPLLALRALVHRRHRPGTATPIPRPGGAVRIPTWDDEGPGIAKILFVGVASEHRCRGLAARLYGELIRRLARMDVKRVDARIGTHNAASIRLHERTGWLIRPDVGCVFATRLLL